MMSRQENIAPKAEEQGNTPVDTQIAVSVSPKALEAGIRLTAPLYGGREPDRQMLDQALSDSGVVYGIKSEKLEALVKEPLYDTEILIAQGKAMQCGQNGSYTLLIRTEKILRPKENPDGTVNLYDLDIVENVKKGQLLCTIVPPTNGVPGTTVTGAEIPAKNGCPVASMTGENTVLSEDETAIYSSIDGQVAYIGNKINVSQTFTVQEDVDSSTGDVNVTGNVIVRGTVRPGFRVTATGNIEVKSTVELGVLKAGGSIVLRGGIIGGQMQCKAELTSRFIENCRVDAEGEVKAEYILNSRIMCRKSIRTFGQYAKIVGGECVSGEDIEAREIGSHSGTGTSVELTIDPSVTKRQQELEKTIPELKAQLSRLSPLVAMLNTLKDTNRLTPDKQEVFESAQFSYTELKKNIDLAQKEEAEVKQQLLSREYGRIICKGTVFPGTKIKIGDERMTVNMPMSGTSLYYENGEICQGIA